MLRARHVDADLAVLRLRHLQAAVGENQGHQFAVLRPVIHHQHGCRRKLPACLLDWFVEFSRGRHFVRAQHLHAGERTGVYRHDKGTALSNHAGGDDVAAHCARKPPADGEAQSSPAETASDRTIGLSEWIEHAFQALGRNADAGVGDVNHQLRLRSGLDQPKRYMHTTALGELNRITDEISDNASQVGRVCLNRGRHRAFGGQFERNILLAGLYAEYGDDLAHQQMRRTGDPLYVERACFDL